MGKRMASRRLTVTGEDRAATGSVSMKWTSISKSINRRSEKFAQTCDNIPCPERHRFAAALRNNLPRTGFKPLSVALLSP